MDTNGNYIQNQFCSYEIALKLKELGFDEECFGYYFEAGNQYLLAIEQNVNPIMGIRAPLWQQVIDWFREKRGIWIEIKMMYYDEVFYNYTIIQGNGKVTKCDESSYEYYESLEQAILEAIEIVKKKNNKQ